MANLCPVNNFVLHSTDKVTTQMIVERYSRKERNAVELEPDYFTLNNTPDKADSDSVCILMLVRFSTLRASSSWQTASQQFGQEVWEEFLSNYCQERMLSWFKISVLIFQSAVCLSIFYVEFHFEQNNIMCFLQEAASLALNPIDISSTSPQNCDKWNSSTHCKIMGQNHPGLRTTVLQKERDCL